MDFEAYSERLATFHEYCFDNKPKKVEQKRFQVVNESMEIKSVRKTQFAGSNDKRFYFHDGIVFFPFGHFLSEKTREEEELYTTYINSKKNV